MSPMAPNYERRFEDAFLRSARSLKEYFQVGSLTRVGIVGVQHLLPSNYRMFKWLIENLGLPSFNVHLLGKCYSTDDKSLAAFEALGLRISADSKLYRPHQPFTEYFGESIDRFWSEAMLALSSRLVEHLIVLDDGGHLIRRALRDGTNGLRYRMVGIEQTSGGYRSLEDGPLMPVVNVARSHLKLADEARVIAISVVDRALEKLRVDSSALGLVLGAGVIGKRVVERLRQCGKRLHVADLQRNRSDIPPESIRGRLHEYDYIIGATGERSIRETDLAVLRSGCILMSASSGDVEFPSEVIRSLGSAPANNCHADVEFKGLVLANCGFPINFVEDVNLTDPAPMFLTRGLILAAILQSVATPPETGIGWLGLDAEATILVHAEYLRAFRATEYRWIRGADPCEETFLERLRDLYSFNELFAEIGVTAFRNVRLEAIKCRDDELVFCFRDPSVELVSDGSLRSALAECLNFGGYEEDELSVTLQILALCAAGVVLDLGAHIGWYAVTIAARFPERTVHCLEPMPHTYAVLLRNIALNDRANIVPHQVAASAGKGTVRFFYNREHSVLASTVRNVPEAEECDSILAETISVDAIRVAWLAQPVVFIKCDVEGAEYSVLLGAEDTLRQHRPALLLELYEP